MSMLWPWMIMGAGIVALFAYRFLVLKKRVLDRQADVRLRKAVSPDFMPMAISIVVLIAALYVILSKNAYADASQKWAFGVVGTILGYWLKK